jgi:hypothetical protein
MKKIKTLVFDWIISSNAFWIEAWESKEFNKVLCNSNRHQMSQNIFFQRYRGQEIRYHSCLRCDAKLFLSNMGRELYQEREKKMREIEITANKEHWSPTVFENETLALTLGKGKYKMGK